MIKHSLVEEVVHISIDKMDFSYRIPSHKIGKTIHWKIGEKETDGIVMKNVSVWTLQLFTKKPMDEIFLSQFKSIVQEYAPTNSIDWKETMQAVAIQNEYKRLVAINKNAVKKNDEAGLISILEEKFNLA